MCGIVLLRAPTTVCARACVQGVSAKTFVQVLEFLYTDHVDVDADDAIKLFAAADMFTLARLKCMCESVVRSGLCVDTAASLLQAADAHAAAAPLRDICKAFVVQNFDVVSKTDAFPLLSKELIVEVLLAR